MCFRPSDCHQGRDRGSPQPASSMSRQWSLQAGLQHQSGETLTKQLDRLDSF
jgi:hypothetical protein